VAGCISTGILGEYSFHVLIPRYELGKCGMCTGACRMVPKQIWEGSEEAVFGFGWDTASLGRHVMCSKVKSPQSTKTISVKAREGA
jgi:hypothetical protein